MLSARARGVTRGNGWRGQSPRQRFPATLIFQLTPGVIGQSGNAPVARTGASWMENSARRDKSKCPRRDPPYPRLRKGGRMRRNVLLNWDCGRIDASPRTTVQQRLRDDGGLVQ